MARWLVVMAEGVTWFIAAVRFNRGPNLNFSEPLRPETPEVRKVEEPLPRALLAARRSVAGRLGPGRGRAGSGCGATYPQILNFPGAGIV